ncbi:hypothetical protein JCM30760_00140 [Thiomicrorhabdus hydrogeniphila]
MQDTSHHKTYKHGHGSDEQHKKDQALFSHLLEYHNQLTRTTEQLPNGICSRTTSESPKLVKILQEHVTGMEKRFGMGRAIRSWDPLFSALFEYKEQITMEYHNIENGVEATLTSDDPKIIELIQCHDETLHGFVNEGFDAGKRESPKPSWLADE